MHNIKNILESRSGAGYYLECDKGNRIERLSSIRAEAIDLETQSLSDQNLVSRFQETIGMENFSYAIRELQISGFPLSTNQRIGLQSMLATSVQESARRELAESMGCTKYPCCLLCPEGVDIVATEIWRYMTGEVT